MQSNNSSRELNCNCKGSFENLLLFGDAVENSLQRRALEIVYESFLSNRAHDLHHTAPNRTKRLQAFRAVDKPRVMTDSESAL